MESSAKPVIAGYLLIATGILAVLGMIFIILVLWALSQGMAVGYAGPSSVPLSFIAALGFVLCIPGIISILGGVFALKRRRWGLALAGAICSCFYFNVLGIPALVLIILSKNELTSNLAKNVNYA